MAVSEYMWLAIVFGAVSLGAYALFMLFDPYWLRVRQRMDRLSRPDGDSPHVRLGSGEIEAAKSRPATLMQRIFPHHAAEQPLLQQRLARAGIDNPRAVYQYFSARIALVILFGGGALGMGATEIVPIGTAAILACAMGGLAAMAPSFWLDHAIAQRHCLLRRSLPDFLDLMIVCLQGGLSLQDTIRKVGDELQIAHPVLAVELSRVQRDVELSLTVEQALRRFAERTNYEGVRTLSTFIREAQRFGTNIIEALRSHADMLRFQREQMAEENAQKASVKILLPTLFLIFPAIFVVAVGPAIIQIQESFAAM